MTAIKAHEEARMALMQAILLGEEDQEPEEELLNATWKSNPRQRRFGYILTRTMRHRLPQPRRPSAWPVSDLVRAFSLIIGLLWRANA